jgi:hypothetical protein
MVVVPVEVVSVLVSMVGASTDVVVPDVMSVVLTEALGALVVVVVLRAADAVVAVVDAPGTLVTDGVLECREVWTTANTSTPNTARPAAAAANTAQGRSCHCAASGAVGRSSTS